MEEQIPKLQCFFKKCNEGREEDEGDDINNDRDYWEFQDPEKVDSWSLHMIPFKNIICFSCKYKVGDNFYVVSYDEKIKEVAHYKAAVVKIHCVNAISGKSDKEQCHFTIILDTKKIPFTMTHFLETLEPIEYRTDIPDFEKKIDAKEYCTPAGNPLSG